MTSSQCPPASPTQERNRLSEADGDNTDDRAATKASTHIDRLINRLITARADDLHAKVLGCVERRLLLRVLNDADGNRSGAARVLGITRNSLRHKMSEHGISIDRSAVVCGED